MRVFVTGASGQLGRDVMKELRARGHEVTGCARNPDDEAIVPLDITDGDATSLTIANARPDAVIHCAAWTDVEGAEDAGNREAVYSVNVTGTQNVAEAAKECGASLVYISTDYVFSGRGTKPWKPEDGDLAPLNHYGETKLAGERAAAAITDRLFIVRTSWLFGTGGKNFVKAIVRAAWTGRELRVVDDQVGTPTYTRDLAVLLADMIETEKYGCYHATNEGGYISWYDFACEIVRQAGTGAYITPVSTDKYDLAKAARPGNSRLDKSRLTEAGFTLLPDWREALKEYLKEEEF